LDFERSAYRAGSGLEYGQDAVACDDVTANVAIAVKAWRGE